MSRGRLVERADATPPMGPGNGPPESLFQQAHYFDFHARGEERADGRYFTWWIGDAPVASIHFTALADGCWRSPARGTYAGYAFVPELALDELLAFHDQVEQRLRRLGARVLEVLPVPMAHDPRAFSVQTYALRSRGFEVSRCDLNQSLDVDDRPLSERMSHGNRKRLAKCEREGLRCVQVDAEALAPVYDTIAANRAARGFPVSMSLAQLQAMAGEFPEVLRLFACQRDGDTEMAAAAVCLSLDARTLYVFYWGDRPGHASLSPVVMVADAVYRHAQACGHRMLDVGTSTLDRESNAGLLHFKRGLGFTESLKLRMEKRL